MENRKSLLLLLDADGDGFSLLRPWRVGMRFLLDLLVRPTAVRWHVIGGPGHAWYVTPWLGVTLATRVGLGNHSPLRARCCVAWPCFAAGALALGFRTCGVGRITFTHVHGALRPLEAGLVIISEAERFVGRRPLEAWAKLFGDDLPVARLASLVQASRHVEHFMMASAADMVTGKLGCCLSGRPPRAAAPGSMATTVCPRSKCRIHFSRYLWLLCVGVAFRLPF